MSGSNRGHEEAQIIEQFLGDEARLWRALRREIHRLEARAPGNGLVTTDGGVERIADRPIWWWDAKLIEWLHSPSTEQEYGRDLVRGLRNAIKDLGADGLASLIVGALTGRSTPEWVDLGGRAS